MRARSIKFVILFTSTASNRYIRAHAYIYIYIGLDPKENKTIFRPVRLRSEIFHYIRNVARKRNRDDLTRAGRAIFANFEKP